MHTAGDVEQQEKAGRIIPVLKLSGLATVMANLIFYIMSQASNGHGCYRNHLHEYNRAVTFTSEYCSMNANITVWDKHSFVARIEKYGHFDVAHVQINYESECFEDLITRGKRNGASEGSNEKTKNGNKNR